MVLAAILVAAAADSDAPAAVADRETLPSDTLAPQPKKPAVSTGRAFAPGGRQVAPGAGLDLSGPVAMILPLDAPGLIGEAASAFLRGYEDAATAAGIRAALDIYGTDGREVSGLAGYQQAVEEGSSVIVAAMVRGVADRIVELDESQQVFSLLLQLPDEPEDASGDIYFFPLGAEVEAVQFVSTIGLAAEQTYVLVEPNRIGHRLLDAIRREWGQRDATALIERQILNNDSWRELHEELRAFLEVDEDEPATASVQLPAPPAIFVAGSRTFANRARLNVPSAIDIYVPASTFTGVRQRASARLVASRGMRFFEMPALLAPEDFPPPPAAAANHIAQRFYAAGLDAFMIVANAAIWSTDNYWQGEGATGALALRGRSFRRNGIEVEVGSDGRLRQLDQ